MRTYDILNAGPRNRFLAAGKIVSNSGWMFNPQNLPRINPAAPKLSDALRNSIRAPKGYKIVVADLSGIELRVNHFLWKVPSSMALFRASPDKADLYKDFAAMLYNVPLEDVSKIQRQIGKVAHLGLGFGSGAATFQKVAKIMGGVDLTPEECADIVSRWRDAYREIVQGWKYCHAMLPMIAGGSRTTVDPWGLVTTCKEGLKLPNGRLIRYPALRTEPTAEGRDEWVYGEGRHKTRIYAGKIDENCLAEGTLVLTQRGWVPIETVTEQDRVHDGIEFISHEGVVYKAVQPCLQLDGVYMTPDHEVLTDDGWKEASQVQRHYGANIRRFACDVPQPHNREIVGMDISVPMWKADAKTGVRCNERNKTRRAPQLRLFDAAVDIQGQQLARNVEAAAVRSVPKHGGSVHPTHAPIMEKLRRAWDYCVLPMVGEFCKLLGRYGRDVSTWAGIGSNGQQWAVQQRELSVGAPARKCDEPTRVYSDGRCTTTQCCDGYRSVNAIQPHSSRLAGRRIDPTTIVQKPVYDIVNCGPRHRFVVLGQGGPFVVHNCVQALARDIIADVAFNAYRETKLRPSLTVHDELVYVAPENEAEDILDCVQCIMRTPPAWWPELVTWSEGDTADTYGSAK